MRNLEKRVEDLEAKVRPPVDVSIVELDDEGRVAGFHVAYRFDESGAVIGMRFGRQVFDQISFETIREMRGRAFAECQALADLWRGVMPLLSDRSRGLPYGVTEGERARKHEAGKARQAKDAALLARVEKDARRRPGEQEWGERVVPILVAMCDG